MTVFYFLGWLACVVLILLFLTGATLGDED
jgi:hypothetical protein